MLPFHTPGDVVDGQVVKPDGSPDEARTESLARALKWHPGKGSMTPAMARNYKDPREQKDKKGR